MLRKLRKPSFGGDVQQVRVSESQAEIRQAMYGVSLSPVTDGRGKKKKAELRNPIISAFCWSGETERQCSAYRYRTEQACWRYAASTKRCMAVSI